MQQPNALELKREIEWRKCQADPEYFLDTYWQIETVGKGYQNAGLRDYQREEVQTWDAVSAGEASDHQVRLKARQIGFTTLATGYAFWSAFFHDHHQWLIAQQSENDAKRTLFSKVKMPYTLLPAWMRKRGPDLVVDNSEEMRFSNGSGVSAIHSGSHAARSRAVYGVIMDEGAFMEDAEALFGALDPLCYGIFLLFSTANGIGNWFHDIWLDSLNPGGIWESGFYPWSMVPGRDEDWYERTRLAYRTSPWLFYQEYPTTPDEAFAKSGRTALPVELLEQDMDFCAPVARLDMAVVDVYYQSGVPTVVQVTEAEISGGEEAEMELWVWLYPYTERDEEGRLLRQPNFVVAVDVSEGLADGDYTAITVFDANTGEECASLKAPVPLEMIGPMTEWIAHWYYTGLVLVERNNAGVAPLQYLMNVGYPRLFRMDTLAAQRRGDRTPRYGYHTNRSTKPKMLSEFLAALRDGHVLLHDERFLIEARTFLADGKGGYGASPGRHDDKIMSTMIGWQGVLDAGQYPIVWVDDTEKPPTFGEIFGLMMANTRKPNSDDVLARPIGQPKINVSAKQSWLLR